MPLATVVKWEDQLRRELNDTVGIDVHEMSRLDPTLVEVEINNGVCMNVA